MSRPAPGRSLRMGSALVGIAGIAVLAGCAGSQTDPAIDDAPLPGADDPAGIRESGAATGVYADGTYRAPGSYATPESVETIQVTVTLEDNTVTDVEVVGDPKRPESEEYQGRFIGGISDEVVGKNIDELSVSRVAGSSLTSGGFNDALEKIKAEASAAS